MCVYEVQGVGATEMSTRHPLPGTSDPQSADMDPLPLQTMLMTSWPSRALHSHLGLPKFFVIHLLFCGHLNL